MAVLANLSPEVQAAIVTLAGQWAFDWANEREKKGTTKAREDIFIEDFVLNHKLLVKAIKQAEK